MNIFTKSLFLGACSAIAIALNASGLSIMPSSPTPILTFSSNSQAVISAQLNAFLDPDPTLAYKQNVDGPEEGPFAASYSTSFFNTPSDPSDATISYISGPKITAEDIYLLVKDGNHAPAAYLFDISAWNGMESLVLTGFWPQGGAISHVSIYTSGNAPVPDGGATLMLFGSALGCLTALRRRFA